MSCQSPKQIWLAGRLRTVQPGDVLPGQEPMPEELAGFKNAGMRGGYYLPVDCGRCPSCIFKAVMSKTGAMLCEAQHSGEVAFLTMTYAPDPGSRQRADMADKILQPKHIRGFREDLRRDPYYGKFRSVVAGEYGDLRGRAHWHCILYAAPGERLPEFDYGVRSHFKHWPHGHVFVEPNASQQAFSYVASYAIKSLRGGGPSQLHLSASRRPVIGHRTFVELAERAADFLVAPSFHYLPPGGNRRYNYTMRDRSRDLYIDAYLDRLALVRPDDPTFSALRGPLMQTPQGTAFQSRDEWMQKAVMDGLRRREARLNPVNPAELLAADADAMADDLQDRQDRQARINRHKDRLSLPDDLARSTERLKRLAAERRLADELRRVRSFSTDPHSPEWDAFDPDAYARQVATAGRWWD